MRNLLKILLLSLCLIGAAHATPSYFGQASAPADNGAQDSSVARTITPPASMTAGDLVIIYASTLEASGTFTVSTTGGQTWNSETQNGTAIIRRIFWTTFNGTWSADPQVDESVHGTLAVTLQMMVIRPTSTSCTWSQDVANSSSTGTPSGPPYDSTLTGQTVSANSVTGAFWASTDDDTWALQTGGWANPGGVTQIRNTTGIDMSISLAYLINSSAGATGDVTNRQTANGPDSTGKNIMTWKESCSSPPTFSVAPAIGTRTSSTIPINFTLDQTGTVYGIAQATGGSAPTCTQVKAGQNGAGSSALYSWSEAVTATVADSHTFTVSSSPYDLYFCGNHTTNGDSAVASITSAYKLPAWTVTPTISARTSTTHTFSYTLDGAGTVYGVQCAKGQTAPTVAQVKAGQCTGSVAALAACNEAVSSSADTTVCTAASPLLVYDDYMVAVYGSQDSALTTLATEVAGAATNYDAPAALGTICTASPCPVFVYNASVATDIIATDYFSCKNITEPDSLAITWTNDGNFTYAPTAARELLHCKYQDLSAFGMFSGANPADFYVNNLAPFASPSTINEIWYIGDALSKDYATLFTDPEDDTLTCTQDSTGTGAGDNKRPTGSSFSTVAISGTVTTAQSGAFTVTCTDIAGDSAALEVNWEVRALPTAPDCTTAHLSFDACTDLAQAAFIDWNISGTQRDCTGIAKGHVISQDPAAGVTMDPSDTLLLVLAKSCLSTNSGGLGSSLKALGAPRVLH